MTDEAEGRPGHVPYRLMANIDAAPEFQAFDVVRRESEVKAAERTGGFGRNADLPLSERHSGKSATE